MAVSRRGFMTSAMTGSALAAVSSTGVLSALSSPAHAASPPGDVVGKITVGYQGWFACRGDGSPIDRWWHWSGQDNTVPPSPSNTTIVSWPDIRDYTRTYPTLYQNLNNGQTANLFSSWDQQTIDTHFKWMRDYNCDTAALQRFNPFGAEGPIRDGITAKVRQAAEAYGRKFYIMYDVTSWTNFQSEIKTDWTSKMSAYTQSPMYARQNGKPVVCIWGFGFNDPGRPFPPAPCLEVINWFKAQGCYVIGGVPTYWRQGINDSRSGFGEVYRAFNMISPWMVGRTHTISGLDGFYANNVVPDVADCNANGIDYQPCVMPGDLQSRARAHGDFMWRMFYNTIRAGSHGLYISMFDEYNEGNQIAKTTETQATVPAGSGILSLDEDGTFCSSDYYLRLTGDGGRMLKGQIALTATRPTPPVASSGGDTQAPSVPANLVVTNRTATSVTLSWAASTDNVGVASYQVNRGGTAAGTTSATTYTVTGLTPNTAYTFTVVARDAAGNASAPSSGVSATTLAQTTAYVALRARVNSRFVTASAGQNLIANATTVGTAQQFERVNLANGQIALRARSNNQYVCAENAGAAPLIANRTAVGPWETFTLVQNPNGSVSLRSQANNQYVCAENNGAAALIANRAAIGGWEQFDIVTQ
ncbi:fibronectin type III domain-containing protein [Herbidospora daliensis]|uniref:fibronectin type III domain-containing protein n=1 Tax=Herbidospora daliensis TaxID=295585 RepID=UPI0007832030|nr:fibronectin type III domain-containing protein [Herbidospora daliensis]